MNTRDFALKHQIRMTVEQIASRPDRADFGPGATHWRCVFRFEGRRMTVLFSQGAAFTSDPAMVDVLDCLASDASGVESARGFEDWCGDFGYDTDSRKAEATYRACRKQWASLQRLLGADLAAELLAAERL